MRCLTIFPIGPIYFMTFAIILVSANIQVQEDPNLLDKSEGDPNHNNHKALYPPPIPYDFGGVPRIKRTLELDHVGILDGVENDYDPGIPRSIRRPALYGPCHVSYGFKNNPVCYQGQVCVDKDTNMPIPCPLSPSMPCSPCTPPGSPPSDCPRGCPPGQDCPSLQAGTEDGLCMDPTFPSEDYAYMTDATTLRTPKILKRGFLPFGAPCSSYGDVINQGLVENQEICSWAAARLECISNKPRRPSHSSTVMPGVPDRPPGTCKCMLGLGEKVVALEDSKMGTAVCYIPANKGTDSECDQDIFLPYGLFEGVKPGGQPYVKTQDAAAKFCVPNSECRTGEKYTGLRCMCKKDAKWEKELGTCAGGNRICPDEGSIKFLIIIGTFWILQINYSKL